MAVAVRRLSPSGDRRGHTQIDRVCIYPYINDVPQDFERDEWNIISHALQDTSELGIPKNSIGDRLVKAFVTKDADEAEIEDVWDEIEIRLSGLLSRSKLFPGSDLLGNYSVLHTIFCHKSWLIDRIIQQMSELSPRFGNDRSQDEFNIQVLMRSLLEEFIADSAFVSHRYAFNYLLDKSGRRDWLEDKYKRRNSPKNLQIIAHVPAGESIYNSEIILTAIDTRTVGLIESGMLDGLSLGEIRSLGDFIESVSYIDLVEKLYYPYKIRTTLVAKGLFWGLTDENRVTPLVKYVNFLVENHLQGEDIDPKIILESDEDPVEIARLLDLYAGEHPGEPIGDIAFRAFKKAFAQRKDKEQRDVVLVPVERLVSNERSLPTTAPEIYQGLRGSENPPDFIRRVYGEWLGRGLTRAHIRKLDPTLSTAINNWMRRPGNEWPSDVDLPTVKEQNDRWVERVRKEGLVSAFGDADPEFALREVARLRGALERRKE